jgi:hypothetical protein
MRSCSSRPRHRASAIAECIRGVQTAEGRRRFQFCIERFQSVGHLFLQLGNLVTFNFGILAALGPPRGRVPDVVAPRLLRPYHFRALLQSFQSVAAPFPGDSGFDRDCGARRSVGQRRAPRSRLAGEPIRRPSAGRKIWDGTMQDPFGIQKASYQGFGLIETYIAKIYYISVLASKFPTPTRVERVPRGPPERTH